MPPTLSETNLPIQPKTSDRRSGAPAERSPARSALVLTRISQTKHACGRPTISILNALLFSSNSYSFFTCGSHEKPRISQKKEGNRLFCANDSAQMHAASVRWLARRMSRHDPARTIVVTHHAPSPWSIPPYHASDMLSAAFASDLNSLIKASGIPLWIHGHTHYNVDYKIGTTRIYSNQRGYPNEVKKCFEPGDIIKVL
jgi:hypothetical protein